MYEQTQIANWFYWQPPTLNEVENTSIANNFNALFSYLPVKAKYCLVKIAKLGTREFQLHKLPSNEFHHITTVVRKLLCPFRKR